MDEISLTFAGDFEFPFTLVKGTAQSPFVFGRADEWGERKLQDISIGDFYISRFQVTQDLWTRVTGNDAAENRGGAFPVDWVSYTDVVVPGGFLDKLNSHPAANKARTDVALAPSAKFRLPSETEWEYAGRGGAFWRDELKYSGSDDLDEVGWYEANSGKISHPVGQKRPNQLGLFDMSGNLWEWCEDYFHRDTGRVPKDGKPCLEESPTRVLRGGCHHNWAMHCTPTWRYEIEADAKDECVGFRLALSG